MIDIYLACPYSHPIPEIRQARFGAVNKAAARLMANGKIVFSPISHTHPIAVAGDLPKGWDFWEKFDRTFLSMSRELWVLPLDGWKESTGVQAEIKIALELGLPVYRYVSNSMHRGPFLLR